MAIVADVQARFRADTNQYVAGVRAAQKATQDFGAAMPQASKAIGDLTVKQTALGAAMATAGALVFAKASQMVKKYAMQGISAAKDYEQTVISMTGIFQGSGLSMEEAGRKTQSYLSDLRDFAAKTPFELPQTLDAVKRLLSIGYAANDVKDRLLPAVGDIVAALGQPASAISGVVYAFGQMKSAGRVMSQDLMQIGNALPGFNAKMAIAKELFKGDMQAMTKATESGALDSETAINAIIKAMQKFPGASGAMTRQSASLAGVLSTFNDTVNNALIDGLMPAMPAISAALNDLMPAVESMAKGFANELGPALIAGVDALVGLVPAASAVIPPMMQLASQLTVVTDIVVALSPVIIMFANAAGALANILKALPAPVFAVIGSMLLMRTALKKLGLDMTTAGAQSTGFGATVIANFKMAAWVIKSEAASMGVSMRGIGLAARTTGLIVNLSFKAMGAAAKAFVLSIGPIGWALTAATVAMEIFMGKSAEAEALVSELKDTVDATTHKFTDLSAAMLSEKLRLDLGKDDIAILDKAGISIAEMSAAALEGGDAYEVMHKKLDGVKDSMGFWDVFNIDHIEYITNAFENQAEAAQAVKDQVAASEAATADAAALAAAKMIASDAAEIQSQKVLAAQHSITYKGMSDENRAQADMVTSLSLLTQQQNYDMRESFQKVGDAAISYSEALGRIDAILNKDAAKSAVITGWQGLKKAIDDSKGSISSYSEEGDKARTAVRNQIQAFQTFAEHITDPAEKAKYLKDQMDKLNTTLDKGGVNKKERRKMLDPVVQAINDAQKAVTDAKDAAAEAKANGIDLGTGLTDGIIKAITDGTDPLVAAVDTMGEAVKTKLKEMWEIASPSKFTMYIGEMLLAGLSKGISKGQGGFLANVKRTMQDARWAMADAKDRVFDARQAVTDAEGSRDKAKARRELAKALRDQADAVAALKSAETDLANVKAGKIPKDLFDTAFSAASARIDKFKQKGLDFLEYSKSIADGLASFGAITSLSADGKTAPTAEGIVSNLKTKLAQVRAFGHSLKQLQALGLNKASMAEIISAGPEAGGQIAAALLAEGKKAITEVNSLQASFAGASTNVGNIGAESQFGMTAAEAKGRANTSFTFTDGAVQVNVGTGVTMKEQALLKAAVKEAVTKAINDASRQAAMA